MFSIGRFAGGLSHSCGDPSTPRVNSVRVNPRPEVLQNTMDVDEIKSADGERLPS